MSSEGKVQVRARFADGHLTDVRIAAERPLVARRLLAGRTPEEVLRLLPNLYSICGRSQAMVAAAALDAALGESPGQAIHRRRERELAAETASEHAFRLLLDWPRLCSQEGDVALLGRIRSLLSGAPVSEAAWGAACDALVGMTQSRILGVPAESWLEQFSAEEWLDWARAAETDCARTLGALARRPAWAAPETQALTHPEHGVFVEQIARPALADSGFAARPSLGGEPAECGPLARNLMHPAVRDLCRRDRITARAFARLAEFTQLLREETRAGRLESAALGPNTGAAMGEMARGLLVHVVRLEGGRIADYAIVAPTEWNFHPRGALYHELQGRPASSAGEARRLLFHAAATLDPCVELDSALAEREPANA